MKIKQASQRREPRLEVLYEPFCFYPLGASAGNSSICRRTPGRYPDRVVSVQGTETRVEPRLSPPLSRGRAFLCIFLFNTVIKGG
ncbi:hypothetical protein SAMN05421781_2150 [Marinococcus luteus]|uniref:Uncharacterized protein n=1 Tax=Marinococcus luteus TaxID=1122204 RepID=A0A1H2VLU4_9BACI|nr:hypothetical protein SAMN05421781_2150 [Marinococcus luteus]